MTLFQLFVLAVVQGVTEFLPISSQAHLLLVPALTGAPDQGLVIDVAVHVGTLGAVLVFLWRDVGAMAAGIWRFLAKRRGSPGLRLAGLLVIGTLPVVAAGYLLKEATGGAGLRSLAIVAWSTLVFGIVLYFIDRTCLTVRRMEHIGAGSALIIGLAQVLALLPGASRAGVTMTAARLLGYERRDAARFSMLLSIPAILAAGVLIGFDLREAGQTRIGLDALIAGGLAFVTALIAIALMMSWLRRASFAPFAVYRVLLGLFLLAWLYTDWLTGLLPPAPA